MDEDHCPWMRGSGIDDGAGAGFAERNAVHCWKETDPAQSQDVHGVLGTRHRVVGRGVEHAHTDQAFRVTIHSHGHGSFIVGHARYDYCPVHAVGVKLLYPTIRECFGCTRIVPA